MQKRKNTRDIGSKGETIAVGHLEKNGYNIIKRNFFFGKVGEIDIVAEKDDILVFIEVKYRTSLDKGHPIESITPKKINSMRKSAEGYLYVNKIIDKQCRVDVIAILEMNGQVNIEHLENVIF